MSNIKLYMKQAWNLMKQNKLFTGIYVVGTALAIATTMIMAIVYYVKIAPIYPEVNRDRTLFMEQAREKVGTMTNMSPWSLKAVKEWFYPLKNAEVVSAEVKTYGDANKDYIQPKDRSGDFQIYAKYTDPNFFRVYDFRFIEGKPFSEADWQSAVHSAVITDAMAKRLYGDTKDVVGKMFTMNYMDYQVVGVVEAPSFLCKNSFAQIYLPYTVHKEHDQSWGESGMIGYLQITMVVKDEQQEAALREEIKELYRKYNASQDRIELQQLEQPRSYMLSTFQNWVSDEVFDWKAVFKKFGLTLLVLLLVPALNLSGMIAGRMEARLSEMGVRKSFGAHRNGLLGQVMWENLLLTLVGGLLGLFLAWGALYACRDWLFALFDNRPVLAIEGVSTSVSGEMLFAPSIFLAAFLFCLLLNLLSALIPAWNSLRNPIIQSLNEKR